MVGEDGDAERARDLACPGRIAVDDPDEAHAGERGVLLGVKPAEVADADDRRAQL
jgi:hypothetical protein